MGKKVREYQAGDFIFAKVKGYPAWPARVHKPNGKKYLVYFYGTGETANLSPNMIFDYAENKDKFLTKTVKRRDFNDGVKQIEHDFANNVPLEQVIGIGAEPSSITAPFNTKIIIQIGPVVLEISAFKQTNKQSNKQTLQLYNIIMIIPLQGKGLPTFLPLLSV
uniref:SFRICE_020584 n=1 Tax=Spodoptera frugiperda TaxID=7108 RepID=A0A2H1V5M8_SPOFR